MSVRIEPLAGGIGAICNEIDLTSEIPDATRKTLYDAWGEAGILVFPKAANSAEEQLNLSRCFGRLETHPVKNLNTESNHPELMVLDSQNQEKLSIYYRDDEPNELFVGYISWHSDLIFTTSPNHGAMLRAVEVPENGGETAWIDTIAAYDALSNSMKQRIKDLEVEYRMCTSLLDARFGQDPLLRMHHKGERTFPRFPAVAHPLVWRHPISGRLALNVSPLHLQRIVGMSDSESDALLEQLVEHVTHQDFSYVHRWEPGDVVLWDNWRTLHSALGFPLGQKRVVHRTTISGNVTMGRVLEEEQTSVSG